MGRPFGTAKSYTLSRLNRDALRHQGKRTDLGGDGNFHYNVMEVDSPLGNTKSYTLSRLKRDAPELFEQVKAGTLSANARGVHRQ